MNFFVAPTFQICRPSNRAKAEGEKIVLIVHNETTTYSNDSSRTIWTTADDTIPIRYNPNDISVKIALFHTRFYYEKFNLFIRRISGK
jgi:hypothetical protein